MSKPKLYMMCGLSGSGKTTFATEYARANHLRYINPDQFYGMYNGDECSHYNEFEIWMALFRALHMAEQEGVSVIFDTNALTVVDRTQILNWFPDFQHILIYIQADTELCLRNNASRRRVVPEHIMKKMIDRFEPPTKDEDSRWTVMYVYRNLDNTGFTCENIFIGSMPVVK